ALAASVTDTVTGTGYAPLDTTHQLEPLGLQDTGFSVDSLEGPPVAEPHTMADGAPRFDRSAWYMPRCLNPTGGLISTARDQLRYARFHLGDRSEEHTSELQSRENLVCRLLLEKKNLHFGGHA